MVQVHTLHLVNPSSYDRNGCFAAPWGPIARRTGLDPRSLSVRDEHGGPLPFQIDQVDPEDRSRDLLVVGPPGNVGGGTDDYSKETAHVNLAAGASAAPLAPAPELRLDEFLGKDEKPRAVRLTNSKLSVYLSLRGELEGAASPERPRPRCFAGAATSVLFRDPGVIAETRRRGLLRWNASELEALDLLRAGQDWMGHYEEKRCMQIDRIQLFQDPTHGPIWDTHPLHEGEYTLEERRVGPLRTFVTIASSPFDHEVVDPGTHGARVMTCRLFRVISLDAGADHVCEELYVKGTLAGGSGAGERREVFHPQFRARYFACMDFGQSPRTFSFHGIPDWFALSFATDRPRWGHWPVTPDLPFGYGFATDVHAGFVSNPHPGFPDAAHRHRSFSWELYPATRARCVHLFMHDPARRFDDRIGKCWYESVYRPLVARLDRGGRA